ncbi:MarR family winged helix-turn-helix transcriptional regulator [Ornithinicoccus hortensis]|uniref:DNA-binding MarR family transcriptional regulator n=1 Tax=Ornithinicoccus hortensis TaxID=82346 RepID=A0A542YVR5_9MICO|nr:MarR family transcriptional regulator [Ornithinicoccus hortensis]TQL52175.1 DNA-binding MarR family transcriptional regulator [Ornithinicoccus hortensis]
MNDHTTNHETPDHREPHPRHGRRHHRPELDLTDPELSELDLVMHLARRLRRGAAVETAPWGLSPHQVRALRAIAWGEGGRRRGHGGPRRGRGGPGPGRHGRPDQRPGETPAPHEDEQREGAQGAPTQLRVSQLAERLQIAARSATEVVDSLQEAGLVQRTPDPEDRRAVLLTLTDNGRQVLQEIHAARRQAAQDAAGQLSEEDRAELRRLLVQLLESLEAEPQG